MRCNVRSYARVTRVGCYSGFDALRLHELSRYQLRRLIRSPISCDRRSRLVVDLLSKIKEQNECGCAGARCESLHIMVEGGSSLEGLLGTHPHVCHMSHFPPSFLLFLLVFSLFLAASSFPMTVAPSTSVFLPC